MITELEVICLPGDIPENITVDLVELQIDKAIHLSELSLPKGVEITLLQHGAEDSDMAVVVIHKARAEEVEEEISAAPEASEVASDQKNDESNDKDKEPEE